MTLEGEHFRSQYSSAELSPANVSTPPPAPPPTVGLVKSFSSGNKTCACPTSSSKLQQKQQQQRQPQSQQQHFNSFTQLAGSRAGSPAPSAVASACIPAQSPVRSHEPPRDLDRQRQSHGSLSARPVFSGVWSHPDPSSPFPLLNGAQQRQQQQQQHQQQPQQQQHPQQVPQSSPPMVALQAQLPPSHLTAGSVNAPCGSATIPSNPLTVRQSPALDARPLPFAGESAVWPMPQRSPEAQTRLSAASPVRGCDCRQPLQSASSQVANAVATSISQASPASELRAGNSSRRATWSPAAEARTVQGAAYAVLLGPPASDGKGSCPASCGPSASIQPPRTKFSQPGNYTGRAMPVDQQGTLPRESTV